MSSETQILIPIFALAFWTSIILVAVAVSRIGAVMHKKASASDFRFGESSKVPERVQLVNRNYMNLLELPVLFYIVCVLAYVTHSVSMIALILAWIYVGLRVLHSCVHLSYNNILHRLYVFFASNVVLFALWILVAKNALG